MVGENADFTWYQTANAVRATKLNFTFQENGAEKKGAETEKILRELPLTNAKTASEIRKVDADIQQSLFENVSGLPLQ